MEPIISKYVLERTDLQNNQVTIIFQSDDYPEIVKYKGILESNLPIDVYSAFHYQIKENPAVVSEGQ